MKKENQFFVRSIKFNWEQEQKIKELLKEQNITFSSLVKNAIFLNFAEQKQEYIKRLKIKNLIDTQNAKNKKAEQLARIGNNLNQLAKHCNTTKTIDLMALKTLTDIKKELEKIGKENGN